MKKIKFFNKIIILFVIASFIATGNVYSAQNTLRVPIDTGLERIRKSLNKEGIENIKNLLEIMQYSKRSVFMLDENDKEEARGNIDRMLLYAKKQHFPEFVIKELEKLANICDDLLDTDLGDYNIWYNEYLPKLEALEKDLLLLYIISNIQSENKKNELMIKLRQIDPKVQEVYAKDKSLEILQLIEGINNRFKLNLDFHTGLEFSLSDMKELIKGDKVLLVRKDHDLVPVYLEPDFDKIKNPKTRALLDITEGLLRTTDVESLSVEDEKAIERKVGRMLQYAKTNRLPEPIVQQLENLGKICHELVITSPDARIYYGGYLPALRQLKKDLLLLYPSIGLIAKNINEGRGDLKILRAALERIWPNVTEIYDKNESLRIMKAISSITRDFTLRPIRSILRDEKGIQLSDILILINDNQALLSREGDDLVLVYFDPKFKRLKIQSITSLLNKTEKLLRTTDVESLSVEDEKAIERKVGRMLQYAKTNRLPEPIVQQLENLGKICHELVITSPDARIYYGQYMPTLMQLGNELQLLHNL